MITDCIEWSMAKTSSGYGVRRIDGKNEAIPEGKMVCHKCDNPACFNPEKEVLEIRLLAANPTLSHREIAKVYGITRANVSSIHLHNSWKHI